MYSVFFHLKSFSVSPAFRVPSARPCTRGNCSLQLPGPCSLEASHVFVFVFLSLSKQPSSSNWSCLYDPISRHHPSEGSPRCHFPAENVVSRAEPSSPDGFCLVPAWKGLRFRHQAKWFLRVTLEIAGVQAPWRHCLCFPPFHPCCLEQCLVSIWNVLNEYF